MIEPRHFHPEDIADLFDVPAHLVTYDLRPGYWERRLQRDIRRRSIRARLTRVVARMVAKLSWMRSP